MKKILCLLLALALLLPVLTAAENSPVAYTYSFEVGEALEGEGLEPVRELLGALEVRLTRQESQEIHLYYIELLSDGELAVSLTVRDSASGEYGLQCSLTGKNVFLCRKDQLGDFLGTLVQVLADLRILKGESLDKVRDLSGKIGGMLENLSTEDGRGTDTGVDLTPYLDRILSLATESEIMTAAEGNLPAGTPEGVARVTRFLVSEKDLVALNERLLSAICSIPVLSDEMNSGRLKVADQVITADFLRELVAGLRGNTELFLYENEENRLVKLVLAVPDMSNAEPVRDRRLALATGLELAIDRRENDGKQISDTRIRVTGLDMDLIRIRLEKGPGQTVRDLSEKNNHQVGEMGSKELWDLIYSMGLTILGNAINVVLVLPKCVFDLLIGRIF